MRLSLLAALVLAGGLPGTTLTAQSCGGVEGVFWPRGICGDMLDPDVSVGVDHEDPSPDPHPHPEASQGT